MISAAVRKGFHTATNDCRKSLVKNHTFNARKQIAYYSNRERRERRSINLVYGFWYRRNRKLACPQLQSDK